MRARDPGPKGVTITLKKPGAQILWVPRPTPKTIENIAFLAIFALKISLRSPGGPQEAPRKASRKVPQRPRASRRCPRRPPEAQEGLEKAPRRPTRRPPGGPRLQEDAPSP